MTQESIFTGFQYLIDMRVPDGIPATRRGPSPFPERTMSTGCQLCHEGAKMVLFITGRCDRSCWYCPLSRERKGKDVIFANDRECSSIEDVIHEARRMDALGTGVTGGEPLLRLDRVVTNCRLLKREFGDEHHIHLYTGRALTVEELKALTGLVDEIRLHPPSEEWPSILSSRFFRTARDARIMGFSIGIEVPALPGLADLIPILPELDFLNINELEWGDTNADEMRRRGLTFSDGVHNAIHGAREWALDLCQHEKVHWCPSSFKDSVQLRKRLLRIASNTARPFDEITDDGTIVYGVLEKEKPDQKILVLDEGMYEDCGDHIDMAWWLLTEYADELPGKKYVLERYPDHGMIVEVTPL
jgi:pyruvate formate-lyase activating enzyme-like uncharacterized protein